jgi:plasmid maintenance system killer protein
MATWCLASRPFARVCDRESEGTKRAVSTGVPPGNRLEKLGRDRAGQHSIRINDQWRVCFRWKDGHADRRCT